MVVETLTLSTTVVIFGRNSLIMEWASSAVGRTLVLTSSARDSTFALVLRMAKYIPASMPACRSTAAAVTAIKVINQPFIFMRGSAVQKLNVFTIAFCRRNLFTIGSPSGINRRPDLFSLRVVNLATLLGPGFGVFASVFGALAQKVSALFSFGHQDFARLIARVRRV